MVTALAPGDCLASSLGTAHSSIVQGLSGEGIQAQPSPWTSLCYGHLSFPPGGLGRHILRELSTAFQVSSLDADEEAGATERGRGARARGRQGSGLELCLPLGSWMWQVSCGLTWLAAQCLAPGAFEFCAMCDLSVVCSESESLSCWLAEGVTSNTSDSESSSSKCVSFSPMSRSSTVCPHHPHSSVTRLPLCSEATASFSHVHLEILEMLWPFCPVWWGLGCGSQESRSPAGLLGTRLKSSPGALGGGPASEEVPGRGHDGRRGPPLCQVCYGGKRKTAPG